MTYFPPILRHFQDKQYLLRLLSIAFLTLLYTSSFAQTADSLYKIGRELAFQKQYDSSITVLSRACEEHPQDMETRLMLGRVYAWKNDYPNAEKNALMVLNNQTRNWDAMSALSDIYLWSKNWKGLEKTAKYALSKLADSKLKNPSLGIDSAIFIKNYASGLIEQLRFKEALEALRPVKNQLPNLWNIASLKSKTTILSLHAGYYDFKTQQKDWQTGSLELVHRMRAMSVVATANYANRFGKQGNQYMMQLYPKIGKKGYASLLFGYSDGKVFPNLTYGGSYFLNFKKYWEAELGMRVFQVKTPVLFEPYEKSTVLRGGLSYQKQAHRVAYSISKISGTNVGGYVHILNYRYYLKDTESYWQGTLGTGSNTNTILSQQFDSFIINSRVASILTSQWMGNRWRLMGSISIERNKSKTDNSWQSRFIFDTGVGFRF
jgi:YaiO family outer membrane protein